MIWTKMFCVNRMLEKGPLMSEFVRLNLRMLKETFSKVNRIATQDPRRISKNAWILEAIEHKLEAIRKCRKRKQK